MALTDRDRSEVEWLRKWLLLRAGPKSRVYRALLILLAALEAGASQKESE